MSKYSLELENVVKRYGSVTALEKINLKVREGDFFFLLGPSGCGKTTLLKIIGGLEDATEGAVKIMGKDVTNLRANKRNTATVFQEWALFPHMNVFENIAFGMRMHKVPNNEIEKKVDDLLELIQMGDYKKRMAFELSGGQQQRVSIARSLAIEPEILLLDEPLSNLDLALRQQMRLELVRLHEQIGKTFIYVTHDQIEAMTMGDNLVVMDKGRIEQVGSPKEIYRNPATDYVATFIGETNEIQGTFGQSIDEPVLETAAGLSVKVDTRGKAVGKGDSAVAIIRPENVQVLADGDQQSADNCFDVVVDDIAYFGPSLRLYCHLALGDDPFFFDVFAETPLAGTVKRGMRVTLGLDRGYALCYKTQ